MKIMTETAEQLKQKTADKEKSSVQIPALSLNIISTIDLHALDEILFCLLKYMYK